MKYKVTLTTEAAEILQKMYKKGGLTSIGIIELQGVKPRSRTGPVAGGVYKGEVIRVELLYLVVQFARGRQGRALVRLTNEIVELLDDELKIGDSANIQLIGRRVPEYPLEDKSYWLARIWVPHRGWM